MPDPAKLTARDREFHDKFDRAHSDRRPPPRFGRPRHGQTGFYVAGIFLSEETMDKIRLWSSIFLLAGQILLAIVWWR